METREKQDPLINANPDDFYVSMTLVYQGQDYGGYFLIPPEKQNMAYVREMTSGLAAAVDRKIKELEILGSRKNIVLKNDNIRNVLSNNELPSLCFIVTAEIEDDGTPVSFTFCGAGYGYRSGMCLVGGAAMAQQDYDYESILNHYYNGFLIKKIY